METSQLLPAQPDPLLSARGRLTVVDSVYHHSDQTAQPVGVVCRFGMQLSGDEQAFARTYKVGPTVSPMDRGWVHTPAMVVVQNHGGRATAQTYPTADEKEADDARVIVVEAGGMPFARVHVGQSMRFTPFDAGNVGLRCESGSARVTVTSIPA